MPSTHQSIVVDAPIDAVWAKLNNFHEVPWASAILTSIEKVGDKNGQEIGAKRILNGVFHETLTLLDATNYRIEYSIDDGPSPVSKEEVSDYTGVIQLHSETDGKATKVVWTSSWTSDTEDAVEFCHGIYVALLGALAKSFH